GNQRTAFIHAGLKLGTVAILHYQQRQALVVLACQRYHALARALPVDALNIQTAAQRRKRSQHAFDERAVPAIECLAGISRIFKSRLQEKKLVLFHLSPQIWPGEGRARLPERAFRKAFRTFRNMIWNSFPSQMPPIDL